MPADSGRTAATEPQTDERRGDTWRAVEPSGSAPILAGNTFASASLAVPPTSPPTPPSLSPASVSAGSPHLLPTRLRYLEALAEASHAISSTLELGRVVEVLVDCAVELLDVPAAAVLLVDATGREVRIAASRGLSPHFIESQTRPLEKSIAARALAEGRTFATWDVRLVPDRPTADAAQEEGISSVACAPMQFAGKPIGALNLYCRSPHCFSEDQFHVLSLLAAQGAIAIANARAYRDLRSRATEVRTGFQRVGEALSASIDLNETLRLIVQLSAEMTRADAGAVFLLQDEREGGDLIMSAARGLERRALRRFRRVPPSSVVRRALDERRVIVVQDTRRQTDTGFPQLRLPDGETAEARSVVCVPVIRGDRAVGVLEQYAAEPGRFDRNDIQLLSSFALQAAVAIEKARLYAQEKSVAQTLQRAFLPDLPRTINGFQIGRIYEPGSEIAAVGGDTYDLFTLPDGRIAAVIADVSGQGTVAATLAVMAKYTLRAYAYDNPDPSSVVTRTNNALIPQTGDSTFVTLCYALIDPQTHQVTLSSAAHPPVLHCQAQTRQCVPLGPPPGLIAGFLPDQEYPAETAQLAPGYSLIFYTDGVIEARRPPSAKNKVRIMFDQDRLRRVIIENADKSAQEIAAAIYSAVSDHTQGNLNDDMALLVLKAI